MSWHIDPTTARRYVDHELDGVSAASVETHTTTCAPCRALVSSHVESGPLAMIWERIDAALDTPAPTPLERLLGRLGFGQATARLVTATNAHRWSYVFAVAISLGLAVLASLHGGRATFAMFLVVAPLGPLLATMTSFSRWVDPLHEVVASTPTPALRLLLVRLLATTVPAIVLTAASIPWSLDRGWMAVAWVLPSVALAVALIALSSWCSIEGAALTVAGVWVATPVVIRLFDANLLGVLGGPTQIMSVAVAAAASVVVIGRRSLFDYRAR